MPNPKNIILKIYTGRQEERLTGLIQGGQKKAYNGRCRAAKNKITRFVHDF